MLKIAVNAMRDPKEYKLLKEVGYDAVDYNGLCTEPEAGLFALSDEKFERELLRDRKAIENAGLEICQIHGVWPYDDTKPENWESKFQAMIRSIRAAAILGSRYVVVHPVMPYGWEESPDHEKDVRKNIEYMKMLVPYAKKYGVKIALENMPCPYVPCGPVEELVKCIDEVNSPHLVACLDVGHSTALGIDAGDAVRMLGNRLHCLHIHDNDGKHDFHWLPYYGVTNWQNFTSALKEIGYCGAITLETSVRQRMKSLPESLKKEGERWLANITRKMAEEVSGG